MARKLAQRAITRAIFALCSCGLVLTAAAAWMGGYGLPMAFTALFSGIACMAMVLRD